MRPARFQEWIMGVLGQSPALSEVASFPEAFVSDSRYGVVITAPSGGRVMVQLVFSSAPGDDYSGEENIVTGPPPEPVKPVELAAGGPVRLEDVEAHLAALIANTGHEEIRAVRRFSTRPEEERTGQRCGLEINFHSGAQAYGLFRRVAPAGRDINSGAEWKQPETV